MNSDAARSDAFTKYCIASNMSRDEVSFAAAVFADAWNAGAEYGAERAETERDAALAEVARLQRLKAVAVDIANDREHNEKRLEAEVARLRKAYSVTNAALRKTQDALTDRIDECHALCGPTVSALRDELTTVLEVAIARGAALGYDSDSDYIQRWEELTGDEWVEE